MKLWAWITAGLGLVVIALTYVDGAMLGSWADEHETVSQSMPGAELQFAVVGVGLVLFVGGVTVGIRATRHDRDR